MISRSKHRGPEVHALVRRLTREPQAWCFGDAHALSPDVRCAHPELRSLDAACASPSMAALVSNAGSQGIGIPSLHQRSPRRGRARIE
jgi:hypothetical protein